MDVGFGTPLLDLFRTSEVDRDVRMLAARGGLAPRVHEQLALLMLLVTDADAEIAGAAESTLAAMPAETLAGVLAGSDVPSDVRAFVEARGIQPVAGVSPGLEGSAVEAPTHDAASEAETGPDLNEDGRSVAYRLGSLTVAQRVVRAIKGTREERAVLIRDPSRLVSAAVLSSPRLTEREVETFARMPDISEDLLRTIGRTRAWMKSYAIAVALAKNPKAPVAMSMNLLARLREKDLKLISIDRNVSDAVRIAARRKIGGG
jgi:hypothetical protein